MFCFCSRDDAQQDEEHIFTANIIAEDAVLNKLPETRENRSLASLEQPRIPFFAEKELEF